jgi:hypothetical protein
MPLILHPPVTWTLSKVPLFALSKLLSHVATMTSAFSDTKRVEKTIPRDAFSDLDPLIHTYFGYYTHSNITFNESKSTMNSTVSCPLSATPLTMLSSKERKR